MSAPTHDERVALLAAESERLAQYLGTLSAAAWGQPSACEQWQIQDVVAHLVGVAEFYADNITRGLRGDTGAPAGRPPAGSMTAAMAAAGVARRAIATRQQLGDQVLTAFTTASTHLTHLLAGLRPEERTLPCYHPGGMVPAHRFIDLRLKELAVHEWDMRSRLDADAHLSPASLPAIITLIADAIASGSLRWAFRAGEQLATPVRYRFQVTAPVPYQTDIVVTGESARQEIPGHSTADVTLQCATEPFVLLVYGRLPLDTARREGHVTVSGDAAQAAAFGSWFQGI